MTISIFDLFSIGIGPSSSHTVGPMSAAQQFITTHDLSDVARVQVDLYGSLALTGQGHSTDKAILAGLEGFSPAAVDPEHVLNCSASINKQQKINLNQIRVIAFNSDTDLLFHQKEFLPLHANGMRFSLFNTGAQLIAAEEIYSIGGGFIATKAQMEQPMAGSDDKDGVPYPFHFAKDLLAICKQDNKTIAEIMLTNELTWRSLADVNAGIDHIAQTMLDCIERGCHSTETHLPGSLHVKRRAPALLQKLHTAKKLSAANKLNWLNLYALAVNEENAAGGRIVTAPTNGAAGIIPAVLKYFIEYCEESSQQRIRDFLLTAAAIAILYKKGASISAAEVGCQGEIGVACSMAAGALVAVLGGTLEQIENAAEIGMEHNLGLTCDPIAGLVQIPCIERNAMGTVQAVNSAYLALMEEGEHHVSLDKVIATMLQTGKDMQHRYKETSLGGLAVNLPEC